MEIIKEGIVFKKEDGPFRYNAWPTVCQDESGVVYAGWSGERVEHVCPFGKNLMSISTDGGETWTCPMIINDTWLDDRDVGMCSMGDNKLIMSSFHNKKGVYLNQLPRIEAGTEEYSKAMTLAYVNEYNNMPDGTFYTSGSFTRVSLDGGKTWEKANDAPASSPHGPIYTKDGRLLWLGRILDRSFPGADNYEIMLIESKDMGKTWNKLSCIEKPKDMEFNGVGSDKILLCEPDILEMNDGTLLGSIRVQGTETSDNHFTMYNTFSYDGGKTWTKLEKTNICGSPPHLLQLADGRIVCVYGRREAPFGIRAVISEDGGKTWGKEMVLSEAPNKDLGYPSTVQLVDGTLLTVYYKIVPPATKTAICYTKWKV